MKNNKTFKDQNKYNAKKNGELRVTNSIRKTSRYTNYIDEANEELESLSYIGNFRFK